MRLGWLWMLVLTAVGPSPEARSVQGACARRLEGPLDFARSLSPEALGHWAEYAALEDGRPAAFSFRVAVVEAPWEGRSRRWIELWLDRAGRLALRIPVEPDTGGKPTAFYKYGATIFAFEAPPPSPATVGACPSVEATSSLPEKLRTLAGELSCRRVRRGQVTVWSHDEVAPLTMVKVTLPAGRGYELIARGEGARTVFPARFTPALMPCPESLLRILSERQAADLGRRSAAR